MVDRPKTVKSLSVLIGVLYLVAFVDQFFLHENPVEVFIPGNDHCIACQFANSLMIETDVPHLPVPALFFQIIPVSKESKRISPRFFNPVEARSPPTTTPSSARKEIPH